MQVIKRDGKYLDFDRVKIEKAVLKAFSCIEKTLTSTEETVEEVIYNISLSLYSKEQRVSNIAKNIPYYHIKTNLFNKVYKNVFKLYFNFKKFLSNHLCFKYKIYNLN